MRKIKYYTRTDEEVYEGSEWTTETGQTNRQRQMAREKNETREREREKQV